MRVSIKLKTRRRAGWRNGFGGITLWCNGARGIEATKAMKATTPKGRTFNLRNLPEAHESLAEILRILDAHHVEFVNKQEMPRTLTGVTGLWPLMR